MTQAIKIVIAIICFLYLCQVNPGLDFRNDFFNRSIFSTKTLWSDAEMPLKVEMSCNEFGRLFGAGHSNPRSIIGIMFLLCFLACSISSLTQSSASEQRSNAFGGRTNMKSVQFSITVSNFSLKRPELSCSKSIKTEYPAFINRW